MKQKVRVSIVDDHLIVLNGLRSMLQNYVNIELLQVCLSGRELLNLLTKMQPDILLLDVQMPDIQGEQLAKTIKRKYPNIKIIAVTNLDAPYYLQVMLKNGVSGYILKNVNADTLARAIFSVYNGDTYIDSRIKDEYPDMVSSTNVNSESPSLTRREQQILELIASEHTSSDIAAMLFISQGTVDIHRANLMQKLDVKNTAGLIMKGAKLGLLKV